MFCPKCGATLKPNARFCTKCGYKLKVPVPPAEESLAYEPEEAQDLYEADIPDMPYDIDEPEEATDLYEPDTPDEPYDIYEPDEPAVPRRPAKRAAAYERKKAAGSGKGLKPVLLIVPLIAVLAVAVLFGRNLIGNKAQTAERAGISQQEKASGKTT